jgi:hypothetical protein
MFFIDDIKNQEYFINNFNSKVSGFDKRLFIFNGYKPKKKSNNFTEMDQYWLCILNAYRLLIDSDLGLKDLLKYLSIDSLSKKRIQNASRQCIEFISYIENARTFLCHNSKYYFDEIKHIEWMNFANKINDKNHNDFGKEEWAKMLSDINTKTDKFFSCLNTVFDINNYSENEKKTMVDRFKRYIKLAIKTNSSYFDNCIVDAYELKKLFKPHSWLDIKKWVASNIANFPDYKELSYEELFNRYKSDCLKKIDVAVNSINDGPWLPERILRIVAKDAFAIFT